MITLFSLFLVFLLPILILRFMVTIVYLGSALMGFKLVVKKLG